MATSGSTNYTQTRDEIISDSLQMLGIIGAGQTASAADVTFASSVLNKMVKAWEGQGVHLWKEDEASFTLTAAVGTYALSVSGTEQATYTETTTLGKPMQITSIRYFVSGGSERKMRQLGRAEYMALPNKTQAGQSTAFFYSPDINYGLLHIWPVPDNASDTLTISYISPIEDFDAAGNNADFPQEWLEAVTYNLSVRLAPAYGIVLSKVNPDLLMLAKDSLMEMKTWDSESGSLRITPNYRWDD